MKPKDLKTKHKAGDYVYVRSNGKITNEYCIRRCQIIEICITVKERTVEIKYLTKDGPYLEDNIVTTIEEAERLALAELAAYKLKGEDTARKKSKPTKKPGKSRRYKKARPSKHDDDEDDDDEEFCEDCQKPSDECDCEDDYDDI